MKNHNMMNSMNLKAIILAGGKGTRLYPISREIPKPLLPVQRKPIINYLVDLFWNQGVKKIAISINEDFREDFVWWKKRYYPDFDILLSGEKEPLGTFGGLWYLKDWVGEGCFFLSNGDELKKIDLLEMARFHQKRKPVGTISLVEVENPQDYGVVICQDGIVQKFLEKPKDPPSNYISAGLYFLSPEVFGYHSGPKFSMVETDLFPKLVEEKKLAGFKFQGKWMDCGTFPRYQKALKEWNRS